MPNARFELTEDDIRAAEEARRYLEFRASERQAMREHLRLTLWFALVPAGALTMWAWISDGPSLASVMVPLIVFFLLSALLFPLAWFGIAAFSWFGEVVEDFWNFLRGD